MMVRSVFFPKSVFLKSAICSSFQFNEAETYSTPLKTEPSLNYDTQKVREHERKKKRSRNIDDLEVTKVLLDLAEEDKFDPITGESLRFIGSNFRKELVHHKEYYEVIEYEQKVYAKKDEEGNENIKIQIMKFNHPIGHRLSR